MKACEARQVETQDKEKVPDQVVIQSWIYYVNRDSLILFNILYYVARPEETVRLVRPEPDQ